MGFLLLDISLIFIHRKPLPNRERPPSLKTKKMVEYAFWLDINYE